MVSIVSPDRAEERLQSITPEGTEITPFDAFSFLETQEYQQPWVNYEGIWRPARWRASREFDPLQLKIHSPDGVSFSAFKLTPPPDLPNEHHIISAMLISTDGPVQPPSIILLAQENGTPSEGYEPSTFLMRFIRGDWRLYFDFEMRPLDKLPLSNAWGVDLTAHGISELEIRKTDQTHIYIS